MTTQPYTLHDSAAMPWEHHVLPGSIRKVLYVDPKTEGYVHLRYAFSGKADQSVRRYHRTVRETFFFVGGDLPDWEFKDANDTKGWDVVFREGDPPLVGLFGMMRAVDLPVWFRGQTWVEPDLVIRARDGKIHPEYSAVKLSIGFPP